MGMLLVLNARVFWTRRTRQDALSALGPFSVVVAILTMFSWGARISNMAILALALVCSIANYRSLVRFSQRLFVDSYSVKFFVTSLFLLAVTIIFLAAEIQARPVRLQTRRYNVDIEREYFSAPLLSESFELKKACEIYDKRNMTLYTFSNKNKDLRQNAVILFVPDVLAESLAYEPYFILLARKGWTVLAADFYKQDFKSGIVPEQTKIFRRSGLIWEEWSQGGVKGVQAQKASQPRARRFHELYESTYRALAKIAADRYPDKKVFVVADSSAFLPPQKLETIFPGARFLDLQTIKEYSTPGYGFAPQTNPIFSWFFLGKKRDKTSFEPSWCATQTIKEIEK